MASEDPQETEHFWKVVSSYLHYARDTLSTGPNRWLGEWRKLPERHRAQWDPREHIQKCEEAILANQAFFNVVASPAVLQQVFGFKGFCFQEPGRTEMDKASATLRLLARDWSAEGASERERSYGPILEALEQRWPVAAERARVRVLNPGCGVGRLPYDIAVRGFSSVGNEFSYFMLIASHWVLNRSRGEQVKVHPWAGDSSNVVSRADQLAGVVIPDADPSAVTRTGAEFAMAAGDYLQIFSPDDGFDAIVTCFFIDTAHNVFDYIDQTASLLQPGGIWINSGPLLWHFANLTGENSVEPCWEDIRAAIIAAGFIFEKESLLENITYTVAQRPLMRTVYTCVFFVCRKL